ncbi:aminopeptidase, partial [Acinetobacter sp. 163]|nr:aminopeptidase [Acinetobacter sp. 163]
MERKNAWLTYSEAELNEMEAVAKAYRNFLDLGKTERECVTQIIKEAEAAGYVSLEAKLAKGEAVKKGDKVYIA